VESEGKTLTAINLAVALAQELDHSILLVDADMRKPMMHKYLGIEFKYGLSDCLTKDIDVSEVLIRTNIGNLVFMPAGRPISNPVELFSSDKMKAILKEVKHRYMDRYVIIDTPPILPFADSHILGSLVDGVVFVVKEGRAQKKLIDNALHLIKDANILGIVFNSVRQAHLDGHYTHYYYNGYPKYGYNRYKRKEGE
jgi:exopolysaccharide/PEP-CTERM locus tyrosine autokinase